MVKITTADCKQAIADWTKANPGCLANQYFATDIRERTCASALELVCQDPKVWVRDQKETYNGIETRRFHLSDKAKAAFVTKFPDAECMADDTSGWTENTPGPNGAFTRINIETD